MGIDYEASGGIGIRVSKNFFEEFRLNNQYYGSADNCEIMDKININWIQFGNCFNGCMPYAWIISSDNFEKCINLAKEWLESLNARLSELTSAWGNYRTEDLEVIYEILIW